MKLSVLFFLEERQSKLLESHHGKDTGIVIDHEEPVNSLAELELSWIQGPDGS